MLLYKSVVLLQLPWVVVHGHLRGGHEHIREGMPNDNPMTNDVATNVVNPTNHEHRHSTQDA